MATPNEMLAEAKAAYHALSIGQGIVQFRDSNGEFVQYTVGNRAALKAYIAELEAEIAAAATDCPAYNGPIRPFFL